MSGDGERPDGPLPLRIPDSVRAEHAALQTALARAGRARGTVGSAARALASLLEPHSAREERYALPPLGLLTLLSTGRVSPGMADALAMTETLRAELPRILAEHGAIVVATKALADAGAAARRKEIVALAEGILLHTHFEEDVLYPASLLVGEYLKCKLNR